MFSPSLQAAKSQWWEHEAGHVAHAARKQTVINDGGASWLPPFHTVQAPSLGDDAAYFLGRFSHFD